MFCICTRTGQYYINHDSADTLTIHEVIYSNNQMTKTARRTHTN